MPNLFPRYFHVRNFTSQDRQLERQLRVSPRVRHTHAVKSLHVPGGEGGHVPLFPSWARKRVYNVLPWLTILDIVEVAVERKGCTEGAGAEILHGLPSR